MSKESKAKIAQGYIEKPVKRVCANCEHYTSDIVVITGQFGGSYSQEKNIRCGIGGFAVKKTAACAKFKNKT